MILTIKCFISLFRVFFFVFFYYYFFCLTYELQANIEFLCVWELVRDAQICKQCKMLTLVLFSIS